MSEEYVGFDEAKGQSEMEHGIKPKEFFERLVELGLPDGAVIIVHEEAYLALLAEYTGRKPYPVNNSTPREILFGALGRDIWIYPKRIYNQWQQSIGREDAKREMRSKRTRS